MTAYDAAESAELARWCSARSASCSRPAAGCTGSAGIVFAIVGAVANAWVLLVEILR